MDNVYVAFVNQNRIEKYSGMGELLLSIDRVLPYEIAYRYQKSSMEVRGKAVPIDQPDFTPVSTGLGVDGRGRIWVLTVQKEISRAQMPKEYVIQDFVAFEVYDRNGVLLSRVPFPRDVVKFDNMTMHGDHLFFVDPFDQACVYEYTVVDGRN
jgi:sugar lactone lactonase YvrE